LSVKLHCNHVFYGFGKRMNEKYLQCLCVCGSAEKEAITHVCKLHMYGRRVSSEYMAWSIMPSRTGHEMVLRETLIQILKPFHCS
jgi:hypothetical protein